MNSEQVEQAEQHLLALAIVGETLDPVPPEAFEDAVAAFRWRSIDAELAELVFDSTTQAEMVGIRTTRTTKTTRQLTFEAEHVAVELEVDEQAECPIVGQLVPASAAQIEIRSSHGSMIVEADEFGRFWVPELPGPVVSLRIRPQVDDVGWVTTPWVTLRSRSSP